MVVSWNLWINSLFLQGIQIRTIDGTIYNLLICYQIHVAYNRDLVTVEL